MTDPRDNWNETSITVTALDVTAPVAVASVHTSVGQHEPLTLDGTGSTDNVAVVKWTWTIEGMEDIQVLHGATVEHSFADGDHSLSGAAGRLAARGRLDAVDVGNLMWEDVDTEGAMRAARRKLIRSLA